MTQLELELPDEADTEQLGRWLGETARRGDVVLLVGDLGMGKTTLARGLARGLGVDAPVTSPTFTLVNEHEGRLRLFHFDAYRLAAGEATAAGLPEYWDEPRGVCAIEWPERLGAQERPEASLTIQLSAAPEGGRLALLTAEGDRPAAWLEAMAERAAAAGAAAEQAGTTPRPDGGRA